MAARKELLEDLGESFGYVNIMLDRKIEAVKLDVAEKSATTVSGLITAVILAILGGAAALFGLISLAFAIAGDDYSSVAAGFGIVALIMLAILVLIYLLRRRLIVNPAVRKVIGIFFTAPSKP